MNYYQNHTMHFILELNELLPKPYNALEFANRRFSSNMPFIKTSQTDHAYLRVILIDQTKWQTKPEKCHDMQMLNIFE